MSYMIWSHRLSHLKCCDACCILRTYMRMQELNKIGGVLPNGFNCTCCRDKSHQRDNKGRVHAIEIDWMACRPKSECTDRSGRR